MRWLDKQKTHHGPTDPTDGDQQIDEVRLGSQQLAELVDDDQQVWQRRAPGAGCSSL